MKETTLCYIEKNGAVLLLYRNKKKNDPNKEKWIGVGGHIELGETPYDCILREVKEETGYTLHSCAYRGKVYFTLDHEEELMHVFTSNDFSGELSETNEGDLCWIQKELMPTLPMWEGDKIFLQLLEEDLSFFECSLKYAANVLLSYEINKIK